MGGRGRATLAFVGLWAALAAALLPQDGRTEDKAPSGSAPAPANPAAEAAGRGRQLFTEKGCSGCHSVGGQGGAVGPALDTVAQRRDRAAILRKIAEPKYDNAASIMPAVPLTPEQREDLAAYLLAPREAGAPSPPQAPLDRGKATRVGSAACLPCHRAFHESLSKTVHGELLLRADLKAAQRGCESCHGPGSAHVASGGKASLILQPAKLAPKQAADLCLPCHPTQVPRQNWLASAHAAAKLSCGTCHEVMRERFPRLLKQPVEELCLRCHPRVRAEIGQNSHHPVKEGRLSCVSCHDPHNGLHDGLLRAEGNALCERCHVDKQGPFAFEHPAVSSGFTDGCLSCHLPHGSPNRALARLPGRGLCLQCHSDLVTHRAASPVTRQSCTIVGCHSRIHGSNSDPLFFQ